MGEIIVSYHIHHNSCLDLARGLLASLCILRFVLASTRLFHFSADLLTFFIPNGSVFLGIDIVDSNICCSGGMSPFVAVSWSVLVWVSMVAPSFLQVPLLVKLDALCVTSSSA